MKHTSKDPHRSACNNYDFTTPEWPDISKCRDHNMAARTMITASSTNQVISSNLPLAGWMSLCRGIIIHPKEVQAAALPRPL